MRLVLVMQIFYPILTRKISHQSIATNTATERRRYTAKETMWTKRLQEIEDEQLLVGFQGKAVPPKPTTDADLSNEVPIGPQPSLIAPTGIKIYDEIGRSRTCD